MESHVQSTADLVLLILTETRVTNMRSLILRE